MATMMKAVRMHEFGDVNVLRYEDVEQPEPQNGEVLIRVRAAGINRIDVASRQRPLPTTTGAQALPYILGWDVSGEVVGVGSGVTSFAIGNAVFGMPRYPAEAKAYSEYITAPATDIAHKPQRLTHQAAAGVPLAGLTAWQALFDTAHLQAGQTIFIPGGAGGVGHVAIQLAKWKGATVITTTSTRNVAFVQKLGADVSIDYTREAFEDIVDDVDVVLDMMGDDVLHHAFRTIRPDGVIVSLLPWHRQLGEQLAATSGKTFIPISVHPSGAQLAEIGQLVDAGHLTPHLDAVFSLQAVAQAHTLLASGHVRGKLVVSVD